MKCIKAILSIIITLFVVASCSKSDGVKDTEVDYTISGSIVQDSASIDADLKLFIDKHSHLVEEFLPVLKGKFAYKGKTSSVDELFIVDANGHVVNLFALPGAQIEIAIDVDGKAKFAGSDTINPIINDLLSEFDGLQDLKRKNLIDTICEKYGNSIISTLVIRERMNVLNDSVSLRRSLGRISDDAKPEWLMNVIEQQFDRTGIRLKKNVRLSPLSKFSTDIDSVFIDFNESRPNAMYLYFWADYNQQSIDTLKTLTPIAKEYGLHEYFFKFKSKDKDRKPKRVDIVTICLHAEDSASWKKAIEGIPGSHILLKDGFNNPTMKSWKINRVPYNLIIDRFSNIQDSYQWGKDLRVVLEKMPNNFSTQANGSENNLRRASRN